MSEFTLPTGAVLSITPASFDQVIELQDAIGKVIGKFTLSDKMKDTEMTMGAIFSDPELISEFVDKVKLVAISSEVRAALFKCFSKVHYDNVQLTRGMFDEPSLAEKLRQDYFTICWKVIEANLKPFFAQTFSKFIKPTKIPVAIQA